MALEVDQILLTLLIEEHKNPLHPNLVRFYSGFTFGRATHVNGVNEKKKKKKKVVQDKNAWTMSNRLTLSS